MPCRLSNVSNHRSHTGTDSVANDTIRPSKKAKPPKLPQRLISAVKSEFVELKSPIDVDLLPPALRTDGSTPNEALVDRLGFYITPDREKRHQEAAAASRVTLLKSKSDDDVTSENSSIHSSIRDKDDDEGEGSSGASVFSSHELLSDAPAGPPTKLIFRSESSMRVFIEVDKGSGKSSESASTVVASPVNATTSASDSASSSAASRLSALFSSNSSAESSTLNIHPMAAEKSKALSSLLVKLNQAYDLQQRKRTSEWTTFYEQTRDFIAQQRAKSASTANASLDENDVSGMTALCGASHVSPEIRSSLNGLVRRGVPVSLRREVWLERSGANNIRDPELYQALISLEADKESEDAYALHEIAVDVERTLGNNVFFREGPGKERLRDVLVAFARHNPEIGYSQGLNIIAANLLLVVPGPEDGFALLETLVKDILPSEYYSRDGRISSVALERDGRVAEGYVSEVFPTLARHMRNLSAGGSTDSLDNSVDNKGPLSLTMFTPGWFISAFAACVNGEPLYRFWDLIFGFCDGRFVFCFALALIRMNRRALMACRSLEELMSYLGSGKITSVPVGLDELVGETVRISERVVTKVDLARRRKAAENTIAAEMEGL
jgi:small G protein signaling modulator 3